MVRYSRLAKMIILLGLTFILVALIDISSTPAQRYEISIYDSIPFAWAALMASIVCGIIILAFFTFKKLEGKRWVAIGLSLLVLSNIIMLLIPLIRGGPFYGRQDMLSHIGLTLDIVQNGEFGTDNVYPVTHVIAAFSTIILGESVGYTFGLLIPIFVTMAAFGVVLLSRRLLTDKARIFSMIAGTVLILSYGQLEGLPNAFSILLIPFVFYIYIRMSEDKSGKFFVIMVVLLAMYAFFHPLVMIILLIAFTAIPLFRIFLKDIGFKVGNEKYTFKLPLIGSCIFIIWLSGHAFIWNHNFQQLFIWLNGESTIPSLSSGFAGIFSLLNLNEADIFSLFIRIYGHVFIFFILTLIGILLLIRKMFVMKKNPVDRITLLIIWFPITVSILIINLFWTILQFGIWRMIAIAAILAPLYIGLTLELNFRRTKKKRSEIRKTAAAAFVIILVISPIFIGVLSLYPSPWTMQANEQVTDMEIIGLQWHYENKDRHVIDNYIRTARFLHAIMGVQESKERTDIPMVDRSSTRMNLSKLPIGLVPPHFDYVNWSRYPEIVGQYIYLPISEFDIEYNTQIYPDLNEFATQDFQGLKDNNNVIGLYDNGGFSVYLLYGSY